MFVLYIWCARTAENSGLLEDYKQLQRELFATVLNLFNFLGLVFEQSQLTVVQDIGHLSIDRAVHPNFV